MSPEQMASISAEAARLSHADSTSRQLSPDVATQVQREAAELVRRDARENFGRSTSVIVEDHDPDATRALDAATLDQLHRQVGQMESPPPYNPQ